jgi:hypothetical protein
MERLAALLFCPLVLASGVTAYGQTAMVPDGACPITANPDPPFIPPAPYPAIPPEGTFWYGAEGLWTMLRVNGTWSALPYNRGGYGQKVFWWRQGYEARSERKPQVIVTLRRLDGDAPSLTTKGATHAIFSYRPYQAAMLTGVGIPTLGCWEVTGQYADRKLSFVVRVAE